MVLRYAQSRKCQWVNVMDEPRDPYLLAEDDTLATMRLGRNPSSAAFYDLPSPRILWRLNCAYAFA